MMSNREKFFFDNAGFSYNPATQTPEEGHRECAVALAAAEVWGTLNGLTVEWADDWSIGDHCAEFDCYYDNDTGPETCETAVARDAAGSILASLCCIDDATNDYRRVVEAELAYEAMANRLANLVHPGAM